VLGGRIISARVLTVRRRSSCTVVCRVWSVMRSATRNMLYRVFSRMLQPDALVVTVVRRIMDWRNLLCCLIG
jgi:hypothetical protein